MLAVASAYSVGRTGGLGVMERVTVKRRYNDDMKNDNFGLRNNYDGAFTSGEDNIDSALHVGSANTDIKLDFDETESTVEEEASNTKYEFVDDEEEETTTSSATKHREPIKLSAEKNKLVLENMGLVKYIVNKVGVPKQYREDAEAEGYLTLVKAMASFDESRGVKFSTYAYKAILGKVCWFTTKNSTLMSFTTETYKSAVKARRYMQDHGITDAAMLDEEDLKAAGVSDRVSLNDIQTYFGGCTSLDTVVNSDNDDEDLTLYDVASEENYSYDETPRTDIECLLGEIDKLLNTARYRGLNERRKLMLRELILNGVMYGNCKQSEIADKYGIKRQSVGVLLNMLKCDEGFHRLLLGEKY